MSDREPKVDSLDAGHRRAKAAKQPRAARSAKAGKPAEAAKAPKADGKVTVTKAKAGTSFKQRLGGMAKPMGAPVRIVKKGAGRVWGVWDRAYDSAVARPVHAIKVFAIVTAVLAVLAGLTFYQADHYARLDAARADAMQQGEGAVGRLMSYSFRNSDRQVGKTQDLVTGKFKDDYANFITDKVIPGARGQQVNVQTSVDRSAVVSSSLSEVVLLMYIDVDSEALLGSDSSTTTGALRVTLENEDGKWKVSDLTPV